MVSLVDNKWTEAALAKLPIKDDFRIRGGEMTRLETFTDAAFAFAVTLLVISVDDVPSSFEEFQAALLGVPAFFASFVQLVMFWIGHRKWSALYGLDDILSVWLSFALIAGVLVLVYPLRVMASLTVASMSGQMFPSSFELTFMDLPYIFIFYGCAFGFLSATILALYLRAYQKRDELSLNRCESSDTRAHIFAWGVLSFTGFFSAVFASLATPEWIVASGWIYSWLAIVMPYIGWRATRSHALLRQQDHKQSISTGD